MKVVKFICVAIMIFVHAHIMLVTNDNFGFDDTSAFFYKITDKFMFLGLFLTILPALAGYVFRVQNNYGLKKTVGTATFLIFIGFLMNAMVWGIKYVFAWNILQFIGLSFVVIALMMKFFSERAIFFLSLISILIAPILRNILFAVNNNYFIDIFIGNIERFIFWPFFPWFGVLGFGFLFAHYKIKQNNYLEFNKKLFFIGIALITFAIATNTISPSLSSGYFWSEEIFQPATGFVFATIGLFLIISILGIHFFDKKSFKKYGIINSYSGGILWIYISMMFLNGVLYSLISEWLPLNNPGINSSGIIYVFWMIIIFILSWIVGALSVKLGNKRINILIKKNER